jgi:hypothetical protein
MVREERALLERFVSRLVGHLLPTGGKKEEESNNKAER